MTARIGRPRSEQAQTAILQAARELLQEKGGAALTIEAIAQHAGVGKPTIYRWWPSLADLVLEALLEQANAEIPVPALGSLSKDLKAFLHHSIQSITAGAGVHLRYLMAQAQQSEAFRERFREGFVSRRRAVLSSLFEQAAKRGEIKSGPDVPLLVDMVFGAMWYRLLVSHAPLDDAFADGLAGLVAGTIAMRSDSTSE